jgi:hypothetical protein
LTSNAIASATINAFRVIAEASSHSSSYAG